MVGHIVPLGEANAVGGGVAMAFFLLGLVSQ